MSGIVGIVNLDGAPVDRDVLRRMTESLTFRGPDAQECWSDGPVGFGHTLLRTTDESLTEQQPWSPDGRFWITADARIDGQAELLAKLKAKVSGPLDGVPDVQLILHAYRVWGEGCLKHLIGDFAFAIWDATERRLFCARDHFGVKPFFYARLSHDLVFSNNLNCIRLHPAVSETLNAESIEDFLQFDFIQNLANTAFADIQRLPPGHSLSWAEGTSRVQRYWTLPLEDPLRYKQRVRVRRSQFRGSAPPGGRRSSADPSRRGQHERGARLDGDRGDGPAGCFRSNRGRSICGPTQWFMTG